MCYFMPPSITFFKFICRKFTTLLMKNGNAKRSNKQRLKRLIPKLQLFDVCVDFKCDQLWKFNAMLIWAIVKHYGNSAANKRKIMHIKPENLKCINKMIPNCLKYQATLRNCLQHSMQQLLAFH